MKKQVFIEKLQKEAKNSGIDIAETFAHSLFSYYKEMFMWNKRVNLIAKKEKDRFIKRHIIDSLSILSKLSIKENGRFLDIGSGNGLPGIPIAIMLPNASVALIESNRKKCIFLQHIKSRLGLNNISIFCERFEKIYASLEKFHYVLVRGKKVSNKEKEMVISILRNEGSLIIYAGEETYIPTLSIGEKKECFGTTEHRKIIKISRL